MTYISQICVCISATLVFYFLIELIVEKCIYTLCHIFWDIHFVQICFLILTFLDETVIN